MENNNSNSSDKIGPLIGSIIIILIIVLAAFYLFSTIKQKVEIQNNNEITEIESDLNSTEVEEMEADLNSIEKEFQI